MIISFTISKELYRVWYFNLLQKPYPKVLLSGIFLSSKTILEIFTSP